jgi:hypothetical protein
MEEERGAGGIVDTMRRSSVHGNALIGHEPTPSSKPLVVSFDDDECRRGPLILTHAGFPSVDNPSVPLISLLYGYQDAGCSDR